MTVFTLKLLCLLGEWTFWNHYLIFFFISGSFPYSKVYLWYKYSHSRWKKNAFWSHWRFLFISGNFPYSKIYFFWYWYSHSIWKKVASFYLYWKWISCTKHIWVCFKKFQSDSPSLFISVFRLFTFNVAINMFGLFKSFYF